jgi:hypothetical protein
MCATCEGTGYVVNAAWQRYLATGEKDIRGFFSSEGYATIPPEEEECPICGGYGYVEAKVSLAEALTELQKE